uniref:Uncharacterized protein n=1 Tax=Rhizophora mucronata TaxID=61149 RepID=A0A2P2N9S5_RHIMU
MPIQFRSMCWPIAITISI